LIGPPAAYIGDEPVSGFVSVKAQALRFYLLSPLNLPTTIPNHPPSQNGNGGEVQRW